MSLSILNSKIYLKLPNVVFCRALEIIENFDHISCKSADLV